MGVVRRARAAGRARKRALGKEHGTRERSRVGREAPSARAFAWAWSFVARGELPVLHALAENASAIGLYEKLGLRKRLQSRFTVLQRNGTAA